MESLPSRLPPLVGEGEHLGIYRSTEEKQSSASGATTCFSTDLSNDTPVFALSCGRGEGVRAGLKKLTKVCSHPSLHFPNLRFRD